TFSNDITTTNPLYDQSYSSTDVPWMFNNSQKLGVYLLPNQKYKVFKGSQTFGSSTGNIISTYITHYEQTEGWYEYIMRLNTTKDKMQELTTAMQQAEPSYKVIQRNSNAHIVHCKKYNATGYAIFNSNNTVLPQGILKSVDKQCVIMAQENNDHVSLTVSCPDKKMEKTQSNPMGWSLPTVVTMVLNGKYKLTNPGMENVNIKTDNINSITTIIATLTDGLSLEIELQDHKAIEVGQYKETFENLIDDGGIMTKTFTGDNTIEWTLLGAQYAADQGTGAGISIDTGLVISETITSGIKNLSVSLYNKNNTEKKKT
ncbi:hypothetical protein OAO55_03745, partial [Bacteroidales bacterium]|nr:hypothetical protein [Bacteroidales bacterium]